LTNADAGTLYIISDDETKLQFAIIQNNSLNIRMGGTGGVITWPNVNLKIKTEGTIKPMFPLTYQFPVKQ